MTEISLTYSTPDGPVTINFDGEKMSFGRGSEADQRIADEGLSRLHAIIFRDGPRVWIVDQNSTNGTFVNDTKTAPAGTPLKSGDRIKIGNHTVLAVKISEVSETPAPVAEPAPAAAPPQPNTAAASEPMNLIPVIVIAAAIFVISISAVLIVYAVLGGGGREVVVTNTEIDDPEEPISKRTPKPSSSTKPGDSPTPSATNSNTVEPSGNSNTGPVFVASGKKYLEMSESEKRQYLEVKAMEIAQAIGNNSGEKIPSNAIDAIKLWVDGYARRVNVKPKGGTTCQTNDNLQVTYERARKNAPFIVKAFNAKGVDPRVGLYLAMIESEHCNCLQSNTGPLGMFQFTYGTAVLHYEPNTGVRKGSSPSNPDVRCEPEPSARAAASYMKSLLGRFGTGPSSVPLAIGSYNSGEGALSTNLDTALSANSGLPRDFWTLVAKGEALTKQFKLENFKYVPKFFGAAIVGENPQDFGLKLQPISSYSN